MLKESVSGIRGYESELTDDLVAKYARAFVRLLVPGRVVIGRDSRESGGRIVKVMNEVLEASGIDVLDIGIAPTPTVQLITEKRGYDAGIVVTASHNPLPWNGLKFIDKTGSFLNREKMEELLRIKDKLGGSVPKALRKGRVVHQYEVVSEHKKVVKELKVVDVEKIARSRFKVVVDAVNGACSDLLPGLLEELGCEVIKINCDVNEPFPRMPEPLPENLEELENVVKKEGADVGFAIDPDGDRLAIVSNEGKAIGEEYTVVFAVDLVLSKVGGREKRVVVNLSTTRLVEDIASKYGAEVLRSPVGEINVVEKMKEVGAVIGGEGNGGVIYPEAHYGRDSLVAAAFVLQLLSERNCSVSQYVDSIPRYFMLKQKVSASGVRPEEVIKRVLDELKPESVDTSDGYKLVWLDRWVHIRPSNTEPIIRIYSEAGTRDVALHLIEKVKAFLCE